MARVLGATKEAFQSRKLLRSELDDMLLPLHGSAYESFRNILRPHPAVFEYSIDPCVVQTIKTTVRENGTQDENALKAVKGESSTAIVRSSVEEGEGGGGSPTYSTAASSISSSSGLGSLLSESTSTSSSTSTIGSDDIAIDAADSEILEIDVGLEDFAVEVVLVEVEDENGTDPPATAEAVKASESASAPSCKLEVEDEGQDQNIAGPPPPPSSTPTTQSTSSTPTPQSIESESVAVDAQGGSGTEVVAVASPGLKDNDSVHENVNGHGQGQVGTEELQNGAEVVLVMADIKSEALVAPMEEVLELGLTEPIPFVYEGLPDAQVQPGGVARNSVGDAAASVIFVRTAPPNTSSTRVMRSRRRKRKLLYSKPLTLISKKGKSTPNPNYLAERINKYLNTLEKNMEEILNADIPLKEKGEQSEALIAKSVELYAKLMQTNSNSLTEAQDIKFDYLQKRLDDEIPIVERRRVEVINSLKAKEQANKNPRKSRR